MLDKITEAFEQKTVKYTLFFISIIGCVVCIFIMLPIIQNIIINITETMFMHRKLADHNKWMNLMFGMGYRSIVLFAFVLYFYTRKNNVVSLLLLLITFSVYLLLYKSLNLNFMPKYISLFPMIILSIAILDKIFVNYWRSNSLNSNVDVNSRISIIVVITLYVLVLAFNWNRMYYGIDLNDEAYHVAEAYIVCNGAIPFTDIWLQGSSSTLLYSFIVKLYTALSGGTEGIFLFMRQAFFVYRIIITIILVFLFKRIFPFLLSTLLPLLYLAINSRDFSYNSISFSLLLVCSVLVLVALQKGERYNKQLSFITGIIMALTILAHAMHLLIMGYIFILLLIFERMRYKTSFRTYLVLAGGILTAFSVTIYLIILSGGIKPIFDGITNILSASYFSIKKAGWDANLNALKESLMIFRNFLLCGFFVFSGLLFVSKIVKKWRISIETIGIISLVLTDIIFFAINIYRFSFFSYSYVYYPRQVLIFCHVYIVLFLVLYFASKWKRYNTLVLFFLLPSFLNYLLYIKFSWLGLARRDGVLFQSVMLSIVMMYYALKNSSLPSILSAKKDVMAYICVIILTGLFSTVYLINSYGYVYGDRSISELTCKVEKGVYKGLYTTEDRGRALIYFEDEIRKVTDKHDKVLFMDLIPPAYLMTEAEHCAPSTWDFMEYHMFYWNMIDTSYGTMDDALLHKYFKATGKEPTKIIYVQNKDFLEQLSLWDDNYRFNKYVRKYYRQTYANNAEQFAIIVFERL